MGRPRGSSNPMHPSRLLKNGSSNNMTIMNLNLPALAPSQMPRALEEDLESQARASISLFGFGEGGGVTWSKVALNASTFDTVTLGVMGSSGSNSGGSLGGGGSSGSASSVSAQSLLLMERVCPVGTNAALWNTMHNGETINNNESGSGDAAAGDVGMLQALDEDEMDGANTSANGYLFGSKVLQQYLVKGVTLLPATLNEVLELLVNTDTDDMETAMHHLVGVKTTASGLIYRRRKKRLRRRHLSSGGSSVMAAATQSTVRSTAVTYDSDSSSSSSDGDDDGDGGDDNDENHLYSQLNRVSLHTAPPRPPSRKTRQNTGSRGSISAVTHRSTSSDGASIQNLLAETSNRGNLSLKWVVGDRPSRMFGGARVHYCLLDYECVIVNDWDDVEDTTPMFVRCMQSCYVPQCQPWMDEFATSRPTDLQPTGFMVRESKVRDGFVEVQFVGAILEKAQLPNASRRAKLRSLVARITKLEELLTSRRLSQSLLAHQPLWVRNNERASCFCCDAKFNFSRRRHHCRMCGEVCCGECSPKMDVELPDVGVTSVRVCVSCLRKRRQSTDFTTSSGSSYSNYSSHSSSMYSLPVGMATSPRRGPSIMTPPTPPLPSPPPPPPSTPQLSSSSSSEYLSSSSYGSLSSSHGGIMGERKPSASITTSMLQRFKSSER